MHWYSRKREAWLWPLTDDLHLAEVQPDFAEGGEASGGVVPSTVAVLSSAQVGWALGRVDQPGVTQTSHWFILFILMKKPYGLCFLQLDQLKLLCLRMCWPLEGCDCTWSQRLLRNSQPRRSSRWCIPLDCLSAFLRSRSEEREEVEEEVSWGERRRERGQRKFRPLTDDTLFQYTDLQPAGLTDSWSVQKPLPFPSAVRVWFQLKGNMSWGKQRELSHSDRPRLSAVFCGKPRERGNQVNNKLSKLFPCVYGFVRL